MIFLFSIFYIVVLCILWVSPYWPHAAWWLASLFQMAPLWVLYIPLVFLFIVGILVKDKKSIATNIFSFAIIVFFIMGFNVSSSALNLKKPGPRESLRIMTCNFGNNFDASLFADFLSKTNPDIIAFQEIYADNQKVLERMLPKDKWNMKFQTYLGIASRLKIKDIDVKKRDILGGYGGLVTRYGLIGKMGYINFFNIHLETPREGLESVIDNKLGGFSEMKRITNFREKESDIVSKWITSHKGVLVAGDFNMTDKSPIYKKYWSRFTNTFLKAGFGFGYTRYTSWHGVRIDSVLCDDDWKVIHSDVGPDIGADHRPVVADVEFIGKSLNEPQQAEETMMQAALDSAALVFEGFELSLGNFKGDGSANLTVDNRTTYIHGNTLNVERKSALEHISAGIELDIWRIERYPIVSFAYMVTKGTPLAMRVKTIYNDWIDLGGTETDLLINDGEWHEARVDVDPIVKSVLPALKELKEFQFYIHEDRYQKDAFWIDDFRIKQEGESIAHPPYIHEDRYQKDAFRIDDLRIKQEGESIAHPRIYFTKEDMADLKERLKISPSWLKDKLMQYAYVSPYLAKREFLERCNTGYDIPSLGFVYQLTKDTEYARQAIENMLNLGILSGSELENFAFGFDWCYDEIKPREKERIISKMEKAALEFMGKDRWLRSFHNTMYQLTTSVAACGYALEGESKLAEKFIEFADRQYGDVILMFNNLFVDGEWPEGMDYNRHIAFNTLKYFEMVKTATGRDLYKECDWLLKNAYFVLYATRPDNSFYRFSDNDLPEITDWERRFLVRVASHYKDPYIQWYINHKTKPHSVMFKHIYDVLWYDPGLKEKSPIDLPKAKLFKGSGIVIARSGWGEEDTWFSFKCGDYFGDHCHLDNNSFTIYKTGDLAIDSGLYGDEFGRSHWINYYSRTIAHNTATILDPEEKFRNHGIVGVANDGGQKIMLWQNGLRMVPENYKYKDPKLNLTWVENKDIWDIGEIIDFKATDDYCYMAGDATNSYNSGKLDKFIREVLFIYPDYFIILDRIKSKRPELRKKWILHTVNEPQISGSEIVATEGNGKLYCKTLVDSEVFLSKIGGKGKEFFVDDRNYPHNNRFFSGNVPGGWRVEIEPFEPKKEDLFLNVICASTAGNNHKPKIEKIETRDVIGVSLELEDLIWEVVFKRWEKSADIIYPVKDKDKSGKPIKVLIF
ncbi:endonuclease/exonuclease/phosphatase family protein [Candidatus Omnitrophota bacterium]